MKLHILAGTRDGEVLLNEEVTTDSDYIGNDFALRTYSWASLCCDFDQLLCYMGEWANPTRFEKVTSLRDLSHRRLTFSIGGISNEPHYLSWNYHYKNITNTVCCTKLCYDTYL